MLAGAHGFDLVLVVVAVGGMGSITGSAVAALAFLEHPSAVSHLEAGLGAPEEWRRWEAVNGLASVAGPESWRRVAALAIADPSAGD